MGSITVEMKGYDGCTAKEAIDVVQGNVTRAFDAMVAHSRKPLSCSKGCAHCCYYQVTISMADALALFGSLAQTPEGRQRMVAAVPRMHAESLMLADRRMNVGAWHKKAKPCVWLDTDTHACSVYSSRPAACRAHGVFSPPSDCIEIDKSVPTVNLNWVEIAAADYEHIMRGCGVVNMVGPLQFVCLMAMFAIKEKAGFERRIRGTVFAHAAGSAMAWAHIEYRGGMTRTGKRCDDVLTDGQRWLSRHGFTEADLDPRLVLPASPPKWRPDDFVLPVRG